MAFFFFFYGPPRAPLCRRSLGKVRPLRWAPDHQSEEIKFLWPQSINDALPKTAYLKMIDVWLLFCLTVPFVTFLVEVYWLFRKNNKVAARNIETG
jgi:hypothetical protein